MGFFDTKPLSESFQQSSNHSKKNLTWYHLLAYGISATIGSGIYVTIGVTAKSVTGPAVILSTLLAGALSCLTALCYLELSNIVPTSGSSYSWGVTFLGEGIGWLLGWISTLEYAFAGSCTAVAISQYLHSISPSFIPITLIRGIANPDTVILMFNYVALAIILFLTPIVARGVSFGANFNNIMATINISILICIVGLGCFYVSPSNWTPFFLPDSISNSEQVLSGSLMMIYSFLGFDTICVFVADAVSPRHVQVAVLGTLALATVLYMAVGLVITGMVPLSIIDINTPLSSAFLDCDLYVAYVVVKICALCMLVATLLACLLGQPKIFQIISLDGLLPRLFSSGPAGKIPVLNSLLCCLLSAVMATFFNVYSLVEIISTGALLTFTINAATVVVAKSDDPSRFKLVFSFFLGNLLTWTLYQRDVFNIVWVALIGAATIGLPLAGLFWMFMKPSLNRGKDGNIGGGGEYTSSFCPLMPLIPCMSIAGNSFILSTVTLTTLCQFLTWMLVGVLIYVFYGHRNSKIGMLSK